MKSYISYVMQGCVIYTFCFIFQNRLNCRIITNLMSTLENIMFASGLRGGCSRECILTVQMILTNSDTTFVNFKPLKLWNNLAFRKMTGSILSANFLYDNEPNCMESRTETGMGCQVSKRYKIRLIFGQKSTHSKTIIVVYE